MAAATRAGAPDRDCQATQAVGPAPSTQEGEMWIGEYDMVSRPAVPPRECRKSIKVSSCVAPSFGQVAETLAERSRGH